MKDRENGIEWLESWLSSVASGALTMSQRSVVAIEKRASEAAAIKVAKRLGVHLLRLEDDQGNILIAASRSPFKVLC